MSEPRVVDPQVAAGARTTSPFGPGGLADLLGMVAEVGQEVGQAILETRRDPKMDAFLSLITLPLMLGSFRGARADVRRFRLKGVPPLPWSRQLPSEALEAEAGRRSLEAPFARLPRGALPAALGGSGPPAASRGGVGVVSPPSPPAVTFEYRPRQEVFEFMRPLSRAESVTAVGGRVLRGEVLGPRSEIVGVTPGQRPPVWQPPPLPPSPEQLVGTPQQPMYRSAARGTEVEATARATRAIAEKVRRYIEMTRATTSGRWMSPAPGSDRPWGTAGPAARRIVPRVDPETGELVRHPKTGAIVGDPVPLIRRHSGQIEEIGRGITRPGPARRLPPLTPAQVEAELDDVYRKMAQTTDRAEYFRLDRRARSLKRRLPAGPRRARPSGPGAGPAAE